MCIIFIDTQGSVSLYEFIYSFRDSVNSPFPEPSDPAFRNALKMLNRIKNEISSGKIIIPILIKQ